MTHYDCIERLNAFDPAVRSEALDEIIAQTELPPTGSHVNMHLHSFFSFNAADASPTRLAWDARRHGLYAAGLCDFDVLDGLEEFLNAGRRLGLRSAVSLETRAYFEEYAGTEINSPGEPGITYIMGAGFGKALAANSPVDRTLQTLRDRASRRNLDLVERINQRIPALSLDYNNDVAPLSPGDCPTERHIIRAYCRKAAAMGSTAANRLWGEILQNSTTEIQALQKNQPAMEDAVRSKLIKRGGLAYETPTPAMFPTVDEFAQWVLECRAVPMATWLDGESEGERDPAIMLECLREKGVAAVNIVPDRNWNIADKTESRRKIGHLHKFVATAETMNMPIYIGTEMNKDGQPFYDDLHGPVLKDFADGFLTGARIMIGQSILSRYADYAYCDPHVAADFNNDRSQQNTFFAAVGALPPLTAAHSAHLTAAGPVNALDRIQTSVRQKTWSLP